MSQGPILRSHDGGGDIYDGESLANELYDTMRRRLPLLAEDDPLRPVFSETLTSLSVLLGRPLLVPVETAQGSA